MYFVAAGTLDEVLWKLIEKKFRELGEFVEGKEKLKMVVAKTFKNEEELHSIFQKGSLDDEDSDNDDQVSDEADEPEILPLDNELEHDIEELGREEQEMLLSAEGDEEDGDAGPAAVADVSNVAKEDNGLGHTQEDAIALSDDDEDDVNDAMPRGKAVDLQNLGAGFNTEGTLPECRVYKMWLRGPTLGVEIGCFKDRLIVSRKTGPRVKRLGEDCKPEVGDILIGVENRLIPPVLSLDAILAPLRQILQRPKPCQFWFADDPEIKQFYRSQTKIGAQPKRREKRPREEGAGDDVIVLMDDD
jgi:hypothetical protein